MLRRNVGLRRFYGNHYLGPVVPMPEEYVMRVANAKQVKQTPLKDPKNKWGLHNVERVSAHPSSFGIDRHNFGLWESRGGTIGEIPPVPVYRQFIWCNGQQQMHHLSHPKIFIKVLPGQTVVCKWCRVKYINMASPEDNDENWKNDLHRIATTPETMESIQEPRRRLDGVLRDSNFQDGREPHPDVYRSAFDPERFAWKNHHGKMIPPSEWKKLEGHEHPQGKLEDSKGHH